MFGFKKSPEKEAEKAVRQADRQAQTEQERLAATTARAAEIANSKWTYEEHRDEMRGTSFMVAELKSDNMVEFPHPYGGGSYGVFGIRHHSDCREESYFKITKGQLIPHVPHLYLFHGKFDDGRIERWFGKAAPTRHDMIFLDQSLQFIREAKRSKKFSCEVKFYGVGGVQMVFSTGGLSF
jgi:hypothetical protein